MPYLRHLITLLLAAFALVLPAGAARASSTQLSIIQDDDLLRANPVETLAQMHDLGATQVRFPVRWYQIAPDPHAVHAPHGFQAGNPAAYPASHWTALDALVRQAHADGLSMDFLVTGPVPRWAEAPGEPKGGPFGIWKPNPAEFGAFVKALGTRYSGHYVPKGASSPLPAVRFWGLWNEPNFGIDLAPQATHHDAVEVSPSRYRGLLDHAWGALRASGHARDVILIGETAPHGHPHPVGNFAMMAPIRFIKRLYCLDDAFHVLTGKAAAIRGCPSTAAGRRRFRATNPILFQAGGFAIHPYSAGVAPNRSQPGSVKNAADLAALPQVERTLNDVFLAYGDHRRIPIYNTEYGYQVGGKVTLADEAYYINWAEYISYKDPRMRSYAQYQIDDPWQPDFETGLRDDHGNPLPALAAYRLPLYLPVTRTRTPRSLEVWGGVRPAYFTALRSGQVAHAQLQFRPRGAHAFQVISSLTIRNIRGYFDVHVRFTRSGVLRLSWTDPAGTVYFSRSVNVTVG